MEKHSCSIYRKNFPSRRSLEGHMRSHAVPSSPMEGEHRLKSRYGLRYNPWKSQRYNDVWPLKVKDNDRASSAKVYSPLNSSTDMSREEEILNDDKKNDLWSRQSCEEEAEEMPSQSCSNVTLMPGERSRARKATKTSVYSSPLSSSPEYGSVEETCALSVIMLLRDTHLVSDLSNMISPITGTGNKVHYFPSEDEDQRTLPSDGGEDQQFKKPKVSSSISNSDHGDIKSVVLKYKRRSSSKQCDYASRMISSHKRRRYHCTICNRSFPSHQALDGHLASHKKMNRDNQEVINRKCDSQTAEKSPVNLPRHVCLTCGKNFPSGKALGGHKRSHLVSSSSVVVVSSADINGVHPSPVIKMEVEQKVSDLDSIDLNLPAPAPAPDNDHQEISNGVLSILWS